MVELVDGTKVNCLLYADDLMLIARNQEEIQQLVDAVPKHPNPLLV